MYRNNFISTPAKRIACPQSLKGFKFSKPKGEQKGVVTISNKNLLDPLRAVTGEDWIPGKRYKVRGFWVADAKTMCFDLNEGVQEDFRPVTPNSDAE